MGNAPTLLAKLARHFTLFVLLPFFLLMNACSLLVSEQRDVASDGFLTARVSLVNPGAMSDYSGSIWVGPRYFPSIWPLDVLVSCRALDFESDPDIDLEWRDSQLSVTHDRLRGGSTRLSRCYGREIVFRERSAPIAHD